MRRRLSCNSLIVVLCSVAFACAAPVPPQPIPHALLHPSLGVDLAEYTRTAQGLYIKDLEVGDGTTATSNSRVTVAYRGLLANGTQVDSSGGMAFSLSNDPVIKGWKLGVPGMRVGGRRVLVIPPELGYGARSVGGIPPGSTLVFMIQLRRVQ